MSNNCSNATHIVTPVLPLLTTEEAAKILSVCPSTIRRLCRRGELPAVKIGSTWRVPPKSLSDLLPQTAN